MHAAAIAPQSVADLLDPIIGYHRDRDTAPLFWRPRYVSGIGEPDQVAYDKAIDLWAQHIGRLDVDVQDELVVAYSGWNSVNSLPSQALARLDVLPITAQLAHALAGVYCVDRHFDIAVNFEPGIPAGSRLVGCYPELEGKFTPRDFLLPIGRAVKPGYGWVTYKDHDIHVHPGLRRSFSARANSGLLSLLWYQHGCGLNVGVAVDHSRICPAGEIPRVIERDRWFGAPFASNDLDDTNAVGPVVFYRARDVSPFEHAGLRTEFWWSRDGKLKVFTVEELPSPDSPCVGSRRLCRFVHAIRDTETRRFVHMDGAITIYESEVYERRYAQTVNHHEQRIWSSSKVKLFRLDVPGDRPDLEIPLDTWVDIICSFFRGNELVLEYFCGKPFNEIYKDQYGHDHPYLAAQLVGQRQS